MYEFPDNQSIYDSKIYSLRKNISLVSQDTTLFDDTIRNNVSYANLDASEEEIVSAAKYSFADEFINKLPEKYDTLIIDEVHERTLNIDFLLGYLKTLLKRRQDLKLIITSATIDVDRFSEYFSGAPIIRVSGKMFPVEVKYRPVEPLLKSETSENDMILEVLDEIWQKPKGDVLVFVPGEREIKDLSDIIKKHFSVIQLNILT